MSIMWTKAALSKEEENDAFEMHLADDLGFDYGIVRFINEWKHEYNLITFVDAQYDYIIMLLINNKLKNEELYDNLKGFVNNDARQRKHIMGLIYADVQGAYDGATIHSRTFYVYHGLWRSIFFPIWRKCFKFHYLSAPSKIIADTDVFRIVSEYARLYSPYPSMKYNFVMKNSYAFIEDDITEKDNEEEKGTEIKILGDERIIPLKRIEFDFKRIKRRRPRVPEKKQKLEANAKPEPEDVNPGFHELNTLQKFMVKERCIEQNPLRSFVIAGWKGSAYKEEINRMIEEDFGDYDRFFHSVRKQFRLISLVDKVKNFVIIILYDAYLDHVLLPQTLYKYGDGGYAPITTYIFFDPECKAKDRSSFCFDVFYEKWAYYFKRIYKDSYAIPAYVYNNKYFNYNFVFTELGNLIQFNRDKCKISYCYFEQREDYINQELDDERTYTPNPMPI